mgnify:CR=1 FL=1
MVEGLAALQAGCDMVLLCKNPEGQDQMLEALGAEVVSLFCESDGSFPNHHPDPTVLENLRDLERENKNLRKKKNPLQSAVVTIDPSSGEVFPADSTYQRADTVRALFVAAHALGRLHGRRLVPLGEVQLGEPQQRIVRPGRTVVFHDHAAAHAVTQGRVIVLDTAVHDRHLDAPASTPRQLLAASGAMAETIPPSVVLIVIGSALISYSEHSRPKGPEAPARSQPADPR